MTLVNQDASKKRNANLAVRIRENFLIIFWGRNRAPRSPRHLLDPFRIGC
mgnify:CR=1 FL=1